MKSLSFVFVLCIVGCNKNQDAQADSTDKIKVAVRPVGIDDDNITRSETDVMWVNIKK
jgi:hypothetical protein